MLAQLKISTKLFIGFGAVLALLAIVSLFNIVNAGKINRQIDHIKDVRYRDAIETMNVINRAEKILGAVVYASEAAIMAPLESARLDKEALQREIVPLAESLSANTVLAQKFARFRELFEDCFEVGSDMAVFAANQELMEYVAANQEFQEKFTVLESTATELKNLTSQLLYESLEKINHVSGRNMSWSSYLTLIGLVLGLALSLLISRNIAIPMKRLVAVIEDLGRGNLGRRVRLDRKDEIGQVAAAMDEMAGKLGQMVHRVRLSAGEFAGVSREISAAAGSVQVSARLQEQGVESTSVAIQQIGASIDSVAQNVESLSLSATDSTSSALEMAASIEEVADNSQRLARAVEEIGSSIAEMATAINQVADNAEIVKQSSDSTASTVAEMDMNIRQVEEHARETARTTSEVRGDAEEGKTSVEKTIAGIQQIKQSSHTTAQAVAVLAEKVKDIGSILAVIVEVTEQTNLLALNAAIISAQAGHHGKGFAVVANEIRELSERTSNSTRKIEEVIEDVQRETGRAVEAIRMTEASISEGMKLSLRSGEMLGKIVSGAQGSSDRVGHIVKAAVEQAQASRLMRESVESVSDMVTQIASATREQDQGAKAIAAASELIAGLTGQVRNSTREQSQTSLAISKAMEKMSDLVQQVKIACYQQKEGSANIVQAMEDIKGSTRENVGSVESLNNVVGRLARETDVLQQEMVVFKIDDAG